LGEINIFYSNKPEEKLEQKLLERMTTLNLNSKEKGEKSKKQIDNFYLAINLVINDLQAILEDLLEFYFNKESQNIEEIKAIINDLKKGKLNCYLNKYTARYSFFVSTYKEKADDKAKKKKSKFFWTIFNRNKEKYKTDEDACVVETIKDFDKLKDIFTNGVNSLEENILHDCLTTIKGKNEEIIDEEILTLIEIFQIKDYNKEGLEKV
jgi:predicted mannosyl-3-phosphoglycerate phosphatase (HAD superfamily)